MSNLRPCFSHYRKGTWALAWTFSKYIHLPEWCYEWFVHSWNVVVCRLQGHELIGYIGDDQKCTHCMNCCKEVTPCQARSCR